jgi:hypothetical protein
VKQTTRGVYDSPTSADYNGEVQTDAFLRSPFEDYAVPPQPTVATQPSRFYRRINIFAWLAVMGAGALGWLIVFKLI